MAKSSMGTRLDGDVESMRRITEAAIELDWVKRRGTQQELVDAEVHLRDIVLFANDQGLSWQRVGDALGIRRGCAYQRFHRRSEPR